jgi:hypothetical protein
VRGLYLHASNEGPTSNTVETYAARVSLAYQITEWVLARVAYGFYLQDQDTGDISHHTVSIGLDFSQRFRVR